MVNVRTLVAGDTFVHNEKEWTVKPSGRATTEDGDMLIVRQESFDVFVKDDVISKEDPYASVEKDEKVVEYTFPDDNHYVESVTLQEGKVWANQKDADKVPEFDEEAGQKALEAVENGDFVTGEELEQEVQKAVEEGFALVETSDDLDVSKDDNTDSVEDVTEGDSSDESDEDEN